MTTYFKQFIHFVFTCLCGLTLSYAVRAQVGCIDSNACNFDPVAVINDGSCTYNGFYIPLILGSGPALPACSVPPGYYLPDQDCVLSVISNDFFCIDNTWDGICQNEYALCLGCEPQIYIPGLSAFGPAVIACSAPEGYVLADQSCASQVLTDDAFCSVNTWDDICRGAYNECLYGCALPNWFIPVDGNPAGLAQSCAPALEFYEFAQSQTCAALIAETNPDCLTLWGPECEEIYLDCSVGCTDPDACNFRPFASTAQNDLCEYPGCLSFSACNYDPNTTCEDNSLCLFPVNPVWLVPHNAQIDNLPAVQGCAESPPPFYVVADQDCIEFAISLNPSCTAFESSGFDVFCIFDYLYCVQGFAGNGCTYPAASNYVPSAFNDDGSCIFDGSSTCPGDITGDGVVNTGDLQSLLAVYGSICIP